MDAKKYDNFLIYENNAYLKAYSVAAKIIDDLEQKYHLQNISGVAIDSRKVMENDIFLAFQDSICDRKAFIQDAINNGAIAVIVDTDNYKKAGINVPVINLNDYVTAKEQQEFNISLRSMNGFLSQRVYEFPAEKLSLITVTGTNGKTTITQSISKIYLKKCAVIGTMGAGMSVRELQETGLTTPEANELYKILADFVEQNAAACAIEASSIGIMEGRLNGLRIDIAVFTNLTQDHLDYHGDMQSYANSKLNLFKWKNLRCAVVNLDDPLGIEIVKNTTASKIITYGIKKDTDDEDFMELRAKEGIFCSKQVRAENIILLDNYSKNNQHNNNDDDDDDCDENDIISKYENYGEKQEFDNKIYQQFDLVLPNGRVKVKTKLLGMFNISNLLATACVLFEAGMGARHIAIELERLDAPFGRLEQVELDLPAAEFLEDFPKLPIVLVDFAHTPDAIQQTLEALRPVAEHRGGDLIIIFGCGGDRDKTKRPIMCQKACKFADKIMITSDNPRSEEPKEIIKDILKGADKNKLAQKLIFADTDRKRAIEKIILNANENDVILIAGKGHENYQEIKGVKYPYLDLSFAEQMLLKRISKVMNIDINTLIENAE